MTDPDKPSALDRAIRAAGSTWLGVAMIALVAIYVAVASVVGARRPDLLERLGTDAEDVYAHWSLVSLEVLLCLSLLVATVTRIPLDLPRLGAWLSHMGVIVLALGAGWYGLHRVRGDCVTQRTDRGWTPVHHFYVERSAAVYVWGRQDEPGMTVLAGLRPGQAEDRPLDSPVFRAEGAEVRAKAFLARAHVSYGWQDTSPNEVPAVKLRITDGNATDEVVLSPKLPEFAHFIGEGYLLVYPPNATPEMIEDLSQTTRPADDPRDNRDVLAILSGPRVPPTILVLRPDGNRWRSPLTIGRPLEVPLTGRSIVVSPTAFLTHATRVYRATPVEGRDESAEPAVEIEAVCGNWRRTTYVPFAQYEEAATPQRLDLPGGRAIHLSFSRARKALPAAVQVTEAQYQAYPGSVVPKDYRCQVEISAGGERRRETISLNNPVKVGPYQLCQGTWSPQPEDPAKIFFGVASRPGLGVIWVGLILISVGFPYAFYVKPLILRRRR